MSIPGNSKDADKGDPIYPLIRPQRYAAGRSGNPTYRVQHYDRHSNDQWFEEQLDLVEEIKKEVEVMMASYKKRTKHYFNQRVC